MHTKHKILFGLNWSQLGTALFLGIAAGCIIILLLYFKMHFKLPGIILITLEFLVLIAAMVGSVKYELKKNGYAAFRESRMVSFFTFFVTGCILYLQRYMQGWFYNKSIGMAIVVTCIVLLMGWGMSHLIAINTSKLKRKG